MDFGQLLASAISNGDILGYAMIIVVIMGQHYFKTKSHHNDDEILKKLDEMEKTDKAVISRLDEQDEKLNAVVIDVNRLSSTVEELQARV